MLQDLLAGLKSLVLGRGASLTPEERRELIRVRCRIPVTIHEGTEARAAVVTDISLNGMRLKLSSLPKTHEIDVIHAGPSDEFELDTVHCRVIWTRKRKFSGDIVVGLKYQEDPSNLARSWVRFILRAIGLDERAIYQRRNYIRADCSLPTDIFDFDMSDQRIAEGNAINLGVGGMLLQTMDPLSLNTRVRLHIGPLYKLKLLVCPGQVLDRFADPDKRYQQYSVRFLPMGDDELELLGKYVLHLLRESSGLYGR